MGKHKDKFYRGLLHDLYICFLEGKAIPKDLSDAFIKQFLQGYHGECGHGMTPSESPLATARTEILSGKLSRGTLLRMKWPE